MINIFSKEQIINIKLVLGQCVVYINGIMLITGTSNHCMSKIRSVIKNTSYSLQNDNIIKFNIDPSLADEKVAKAYAEENNWNVGLQYWEK